MTGPHRTNIDFDLGVHAIKVIQASVAHSRTGGGAVELVDRHQARCCDVDIGLIFHRRANHRVPKKRAHEL